MIYTLLAACTHEKPPVNPEPAKVLLLTKTTGFRHESIPAGIAMFKSKQAEWNLAITETESTEQFSNEGLSGYELIILFNTTGTLFNNEERGALQSFIRSGGALLGIHAAADAEYDWPWYNQMLGGWFDSHPAIQPAKCEIKQPVHPSAKGIANPWLRTDEWYNFKSLQPDNQVVLIVDEASYSGGNHGNIHPVSWYRHFEGGRVYYTAMGHTTDSYSEPLFIQHLGGAIQWLLNR